MSGVIVIAVGVQAAGQTQYGRRSSTSSVGFAHAFTDGVTAYLTELLVAPEHRGRGLGRQLLAEAFQRCCVGRMDLIADTVEGCYETLPHRRYDAAASTHR